MLLILILSCVLKCDITLTNCKMCDQINLIKCVTIINNLKMIDHINVFKFVIIIPTDCKTCGVITSLFLNAWAVSCILSYKVCTKSSILTRILMLKLAICSDLCQSVSISPNSKLVVMNLGIIEINLQKGLGQLISIFGSKLQLSSAVQRLF